MAAEGKGAGQIERRTGSVHYRYSPSRRWRALPIGLVAGSLMYTVVVRWDGSAELDPLAMLIGGFLFVAFGLFVAWTLLLIFWWFAGTESINADAKELNNKFHLGPWALERSYDSRLISRLQWEEHIAPTGVPAILYPSAITAQYGSKRITLLRGIQRAAALPLIDALRPALGVTVAEA